MTPNLRRNAVFAGTAVLLAGALVSSIAGPAQASSGGPEACWFSIDTAVTQCFVDDATLREAVLEQTGTDLVPLPGSGVDSRGGGAASAAASVGTLATYIVVTFYESALYAGVRTYVTTSNSTLCTSYSYTGNSMPTGWNDRVSSFQSSGTCKTRLARDINQGGKLFGPVAIAATLGSMDDEASSYFVTG